MDPGPPRQSPGGARLVAVRPDGIIGITSADLETDSVERHAARLGVPPTAL